MKAKELLIGLGLPSKKPSDDEESESSGDIEEMKQAADDAAKDFAKNPSAETFSAAMQLCKDYDDACEEKEGDEE